MTTMTPDEADAVWAAIDDQRARTAGLLEQLTAGPMGAPVAVREGVDGAARRRPPDPAAAEHP